MTQPTSASPAQKRALLQQMLRERAGGPRPLSHGERGLWMHHKLAPSSSAYNLQYVGRTSGAVDLTRLAAALRVLTGRHDVLRAVYRESRNTAQAVVDRAAAIAPHAVDGAGWTAGQLDEWLDTLLDEPIDLTSGPVVRVHVIRRGIDGDLVVLTVSHIVVDFWSLDLLVTELERLYADPRAELPPLRHRYADYVRWQTRLLAGERGATVWNYWKRQLAGDLPRLQLPGAAPRPAVQTFAGARHAFDIDADLIAVVRGLCRDQGVTLQVAVLSAFLALLHRYSGLADIVIGSPVAGRGMPGAEGIVGYFVNTVVLRSRADDDPSFATLMQRTRNTVLGAMEHQDLPFPLLAADLEPTRDPAYPPVFGVFFAWESSRVSTGATTATTLDTVTLRQGGAAVDLMLMVAEREQTLSAVLQYNTDLFDAEAVARISGHMTTFLAAAAAARHSPISTVGLLTPLESAQRARWNNTATPEFLGHRLHEPIGAQVSRTPDAEAVSFGANTLTYRELWRRASELARTLRAGGVAPGSIVGIALQRSEMSVAAALAVLIADCAFLPVDPAHPPQRLNAVHRQAEPALWLTEPAVAGRLPRDARVLDIDTGRVAPSGASDTRTPKDTDTAYVMFTSGTTGTPKGVPNTHAGICNRLLWMQAAYPLTATDTVLHKTPANFDVAVWELFWALLAGARIAVAQPDGHRDSGYLIRTIVEKQVTVMHFVPSMLRAFLADPGVGRCATVRTVITSGEALTADLRDGLFAALPAAGLHNLYGPTEAAIDVTFFDCRRGDDDPAIPIGRPIANTSIHILDPGGHPVPVGMTGELLIGGVGLAKGYLNQPELTADRFVTTSAAGRLYRTGDLARYRADGDIEYLGRSDHQVKIRGVRIELQEIEGALAACADIGQAAVVVRDADTPAPRLVAYLTAADPHAPPQPVDLRTLLRATLPEAMIPTHFVVLERIPTTSSGKRDDRALPDPGTERPQLGTGYRAPRTAVEHTLARLWAQVLRVDRVGIDDDFFELGGASTQTMSLCVAARAAGIALTPESVFRHRTIAGVAAHADTPPPTAAAPSRPVTRTPAAAGRPPLPTANTVIESLGVYLPETVVTTADVLGGCDRAVEIPLERFTGIKTRRIAAPDEFTIDLAYRAARQCLERSRHRPADIDILICTSISQIQGPDARLVCEPSTSMQLRAMLRLENAVGFDVSNACAGMFTGIAVADAFLQTRRARTAMVVSGEYISHIIRTAQREITDFLDDRLACLTVGDAGAAVILERGPHCGVGFHDLRLRTLSRYADLCIGKATDQPHGGAIMRTKAVEQTAVAIRKSVPFAMRMLEHNTWQPETVDHIIVHQTSQASINDASATINRLIGRPASHPGNTVSNLAHRGNTASTTHFVALEDLIDQGRLQSGDRVLFGITGSGQTIGAALYTFDNLPDRLRGDQRGNHDGEPTPFREPTPVGRIRIETAAVSPGRDGDRAVDLAVSAARQCLSATAGSDSDVGLVLYTGVFRDEFMVEPATATFVADRLRLHPDPDDPFATGTLAFDVLDGGVGFLKACHLAASVIGAGHAGAALVTAAEADPAHPGSPPNGRAVAHLGSAVVLTPTSDESGFGRFHFSAHPEYLGALGSYARIHHGRGVEVTRHPDLDEIYLKLVPDLVAETLDAETLTIADLAVILAPQISTDFLLTLAERLDLPGPRMINAVGHGADLYTSSLPAALRHCLDTGAVTDGDIGLVIAVGAGIQIGCATYRF